MAQLRALAAARGDRLFQALSTEEHQVAAALLAGDGYAQTARYLGMSPSAVRRSVQRIVAMHTAQPLKVLIADDHPTHRLLLREIFESFGCAAEAVEDGAQAVARAPGFDIVCLDQHMGAMSGEEAARRIGRQAYLIACTSDPGSITGGFDVIVAKPISFDSMGMAIRLARKSVAARRRRG